jgi:LCP family protein required for cell wall assembly
VRVFGWGGLFSLFFPSHLKGEDSGRVNILLAGNSADDPGHQGANLTDSIMLVSIDTKNHTAYMLSVPRDLYVNIPGFGYAKINEAYPDGQSENFSQPGYANGGMGLLEEVVSQKFGIPIDYYALVNYAAVKDSVNAIGGITVTINSPDGELYDPNRDFSTGGPLVDLTNGVHTLNGEQALDLARARGDPSQYGEPIGFEQSDFQRTADQRMILVALESKALTLGVVSNPIKMGELFDTLGNNVQTDLSLGNVRRLYGIMKKIPAADIQSESLNAANYNGQKNVDLLTSYATPSGEDALVPAAGINDFSQINDFVQQLDNQ